MKATAALLFATLPLAGCATLFGSGAGAVHRLALGQTGDFGPTDLTPLSVEENSRCPANVRCIWAGQVRVKVLVEPANTVESSGRELHTDFWWVGNNPFYDRHIDEQPEYGRWFARTYTERLASFCQQSIDDWYSTVARRHGQDGAVYFAEKHRPGQIPALLWELYPKAKEICLVRDPRDMICSVMKFFGDKEGARARAQSDEQFIHWMGGSVLELYNDWVARSDRAHLVRYEDSVQAPAETLTALLDYLGVDSSSAIVQEMLDAANDGTPAHFPQHQTSGSPEASIGRWRRDLNDSLQAACEQAFSQVLTGFDYRA